MTDTASPFPASYVPRIHRAEVVEVRRLGPGMVRVVFGGDDLVDYPTTGTGDEYVRMFFPDTPDDEVRLPFITSLRGWDYAEGIEPSEMRVYTIRAHRAGQVDVDFVVHEGGIAAAWALQARPGQAVGINPPCGLYERPEALKRQILVADEPGLPAALRLAEEAPDNVETVLLLEVGDAERRLVAAAADAEGVEYRWLDGSGNGHADSRVLDALRELNPDASTYVWVSTEGRLNRAVRKYLRHEQQLPAANYKCVAYWQERAEAWRARLDALGPAFTERVQALRSDADRDSEEVVDAVEALYEAAGL